MVGRFLAVAESVTTQTVFQVQYFQDAHSASFNVTSAGLHGKFGPRIAVHHATHSLFKAMGRYVCGLILFGSTLHHPLALKYL